MRRARLTFEGALHHCMNRRHGRERILARDEDRKVFLNVLAEAGKRLKIRILAYCLMGSRYHLAIENSSGACPISSSCPMADRAHFSDNAMGATTR